HWWQASSSSVKEVATSRSDGTFECDKSHAQRQSRSQLSRMPVNRDAQDLAPPAVSASGSNSDPRSGFHPTTERADSHLALALEPGQMGAWEWDIAAGTVSWSSQEERLYGLAEGTFDGTVDTYRRLVHPDDRESTWRLVQAALARKAESYHTVHRIIRPDGQV